MFYEEPLFYCGEGKGSFSDILISTKINGLSRMTKARTFHSSLGNIFPKSIRSDYISPSSHISNNILLQLLIIPLFTIFLFFRNWIRRTYPIKYVNIKYKYLFLKSKKIKSKKKPLNIIPKVIFILKIIAVYNIPATSNTFSPWIIFPMKILNIYSLYELI